MVDLNLRIGHESDAGRVRKHNEDYSECFVPANEAQLRSRGAIFLVADGMGGHQAGEVASRKVVKHVIQRYYLDESPDVGECLARAFKGANRTIYDMAQSDPNKAGMGTTLVAAVILGQKLYVANVGDSRAYLLRRKRFWQITVDHSWVEDQVKTGTLTREQAEQHPQRNLITRALGTRPSVEVDLFEEELREGDTLLLRGVEHPDGRVDVTRQDDGARPRLQRREDEVGPVATRYQRPSDAPPEPSHRGLGGHGADEVPVDEGVDPIPPRQNLGVQDIHDLLHGRERQLPLVGDDAEHIQAASF
jgi:serine/threonine protein phosphatase PrpC